jgi:hypothetical protein
VRKAEELDDRPNQEALSDHGSHGPRIDLVATGLDPLRERPRVHPVVVDRVVAPRRSQPVGERGHGERHGQGVPAGSGEDAIQSRRQRSAPRSEATARSRS